MKRWLTWLSVALVVIVVGELLATLHGFSARVPPSSFEALSQAWCAIMPFRVRLEARAIRSTKLPNC